MALLQFIVPIITGGVLNIFLKAHLRLAQKLAVAFIFLALLLIAGEWVYGFTCIRPALICKTLSFILNWDAATCNLLLGYLFVFVLLNPDTEECLAGSFEAVKLRNAILWGFTILTASSFLMASASMAESLCTTIAFFKKSGYALWLIYLTMAAEAFGGIGLIFHFKIKSGPVAAGGLMLIMIGALYTHRNNNDPFQASYAAIGQLLMLSFLQVMYFLEKCKFEAIEFSRVEPARNIDSLE